MDLFNIPVSEIRQFCFCPRIPYFHLLIEIRTPERPWIDQGISFHERTSMLSKRRYLSHYHLCDPEKTFKFIPDIHLFDEQLGLHGICDGAIYTSDGNIFPLEFKLMEKSAQSTGSILQLTAYAMLLEKKEKTSITRGFCIAGDKGKTFEINFTQQNKEKVLHISESIRNICLTSLIPNSPASDHQCCQCEFLNFCADRL